MDDDLETIDPSALLHADSIAKSFAGVQALRGATLELRAGEVHALIGENGAGKSTLIKIVTGALAPDAGTLTVAGQAVTHNNPAHARSMGIAAIYQQPSLFPHLTVAENIGLALIKREHAGVGKTLDVVIREKPVPAVQVKTPFYKRSP